MWMNLHSLTVFQLVLVWSPGKASPIHDHANAHCVMKILSGSLTETIYNWPCETEGNTTDCATSASALYPATEHTCSLRNEDLEPHQMSIKRSTTYNQEEVTYMSDRLGLHRIHNPSTNQLAVSLHLYTVSSYFSSAVTHQTIIHLTRIVPSASQCRKTRLSHFRRIHRSQIPRPAMPLLLRAWPQERIVISTWPSSHPTPGTEQHTTPPDHRAVFLFT